MEVKKEIQNEIIATAERMIYYNNGIIEICENWLPTEEANANMMKEIEARRIKEREEKQMMLKKSEKHEKQVKMQNRFWKWTKMKLKIENLINQYKTNNN